MALQYCLCRVKASLLFY